MNEFNQKDLQAAMETRRPFLGQYGWSWWAWERRLYHVLSEKWCGNDAAPLNHRTLYVDDDGCRRVFSFLNDSFEIGIGYPDRWHAIIRRPAIHKFIFWYLRQWAFGEWFGLRRWLWYRLLHRSCERTRAAGAALRNLQQVEQE